MADYPVSTQPNTNTQPKTFAPYVPPTKTYQPFTPASVAILSPPSLTKIDSKPDVGRPPNNLSPTPGSNLATSTSSVNSLKQ